jgi:hypothetical protein
VKGYSKSPVIVLVLLLGMYISGLSAGFAAEKGGIVGWEKDSAYNKLYDLDEWDSLKGNVVGFKQITPLKLKRHVPRGSTARPRWRQR